MANKYCSICKQPYPQELTACPHCQSAAAKAGGAADDLLPIQLSDLDDPSGGQPVPGSDPGVDLGHPLDPASGTSNVSWAALVKDKEESSAIDFGLEPTVKFDALSDADLVVQAEAQPGKAPAPAAGPGQPPLVKPGDLPRPTGASAKSLLTAGAGDQPGPAKTGDSAKATHLAPAKGQATQLAPSTGQATMLAPATPAPTMLAPHPAPTKIAPPPAPTVLAPPGEAEKEAQRIAAEPASPAGKAGPGAPAGLDDVLQEWFADPAKKGGGKDAIAESVEAQVDFGGQAREGVGPSTSGDLARSLLEGGGVPPVESSAVDLGTARPEDLTSNVGFDQKADGKPEESSKVDLGSHPSLEIPFSADSGDKADQRGDAESIDDSNRDILKAEGPASSAVELGADSQNRLSPSQIGGMAAGMKEGELDWNAVPSTADGEVDQDRLSKLDMGAPKPEKKVKPRYGRRWVGGGILGLLVASAACLGLWIKGIEPFTKDRRQQLSQMAKDYGIDLGTGQEATSAGELTAVDHLNNGDVDKAWTIVEVAEIDEDSPEQKDLLAARGETRLRRYLQNQKGAAPKEADAEVASAIKDLTKAGTPQAFFWLGYIQEASGKIAKAKENYTKGAKAATEPAQKRMCEAALLRLDSLPEPAKDDAPAGGSRAPQPINPRDARAELLVLLLIELQRPPGNPPAAPAADDEAGYKFWQAAKLAKEHKYEEASTALREARKLHEKQRFLRLRKAQNPGSDPTEEIFLRSCDELLNYWEMQDKLQKGEYDLEKYKSPVKALEALLKDKANLGAGAGDVLVAIGKKLEIKEEKPKAEDILKAIDGLTKGKKESDDQVAELKKELTDAKYLDDDQKDVSKGLQALIKDWKDGNTAKDAVKKVTARLEKSGVKEENVEKGIDKLAGDRDDLTQTLQGVAKKLVEAKYLDDPKAAKEKLLEAVDSTIEATTSPLVSALGRMGTNVNVLGGFGNQVAKTMNLAGALAVSQAQAARYQVLLRESRTPHDMLDIWLALLENGGAKDSHDKAALDVRRVGNDESASPTTRATAKCLEGMLLRNEGKYAEARTALKESLVIEGAKPGDWKTQASSTLKELTDPKAYYRPRAYHLINGSHYEAAQRVLTTGLKVFPKDGELLALRSLVRLELAREKGRLNAQDAGVAEARKDAQAAVAAGAVGEGHYALGRVAEETGNWAQAEQNYRKAVAAQPQNTRFQLALARVLLQRRPAAPEGGVGLRTPAAAEPLAVGRIANPAHVSPAHPTLAALVVLLTTGLQVEPEAAPAGTDVDEAIRLAEQAIAAKNYEGHLVKALALAKKGSYTAALEEYVKGLNYLISPEYSEGLRRIVENHPAFKRPDGLQPADPLRAEKSFAAGLKSYYAGRFPQAEEDFLQAVRYHDQDARYLYFLGLSRLAQGKRSYAQEDFRVGGQLERLNRPAPAAVSASLERVQGPTREALNRYRP